MSARAKIFSTGTQKRETIHRPIKFNENINHTSLICHFSHACSAPPIASCLCLKYFPRSRGSVRKNHFKSRFLSRSVKKVTNAKSMINTTHDVTLEAKERPKSDTCQRLF